MTDHLTDTNVGNIEYISKQAAIDAFNRIKNTLKNPKTAHYDTLMFYEIEDVLENVEPADVAPVVHAYWRDTGSGQECSACKEIQYGYDTGRHYCANCGAKMDGEE